MYLLYLKKREDEQGWSQWGAGDGQVMSLLVGMKTLGPYPKSEQDLVEGL
jgi:hypothetical protein